MLKSALLLLICFSSITSSTAQSIDKLNWIVGNWEFVDGTSITTETWEFENDSTLVGVGLTKNDDKVVFQEGLSIEFRNGETRYVAILPEKTAYFKLTEYADSMASFEDPLNDFPFKILYKVINSKMEATLFGKENGDNRSMKMLFTKK